AGQEIQHPDIDGDLFPGMKIAEKHRELIHDSRDGPVVVAVDAAEGLAGVRVGEVEPVRLRWREWQSAEHAGQRGCAGDHRQKKPSIHRPRLKKISTPICPLPPLFRDATRYRASQTATVYNR